MKKNYVNSVPWVLSVTIVAYVCFILSAGSCTFTSEGIRMISGDYSAPTLEHFLLENETKAVINFSHEITFPQLEYYQVEKEHTGLDDAEASGLVAEKPEARRLGTVTFEKDSTVISEDSKKVYSYTLTFPKEVEAHIQYILSGTVKDEIGSTLSFTLSFVGYNSRVPKMIFSEICTEYSKPRTEFVELFALEDGNLAGVLLQSAGDGIEKDFVFPSVEVKKGEYIVLHMRTLEEGAVNELGNDIGLSNTKQSSIEGRDLWISGTETRLSKNDVLLLRARQNGELLDAIAYTDGLKDEWPKDAMLSYIQEAHSANLWEGGVDSSQAMNIEYTTATRTVSRQNISDIVLSFEAGESYSGNSKDDWVIVATSNLTPGKENSTKAYVK